MDSKPVCIKQVPKTRVTQWAEIEGRQVPKEFLSHIQAATAQGVVQVYDWFERKTRYLKIENNSYFWYYWYEKVINSKWNEKFYLQKFYMFEDTFQIIGHSGLEPPAFWTDFPDVKSHAGGLSLWIPLAGKQILWETLSLNRLDTFRYYPQFDFTPLLKTKFLKYNLY